MKKCFVILLVMGCMLGLLYANVVPLIGHGNVRGSVLGYENRQPSREEMERMKELVRDGMDAGAWGLSSGLFYPPGVYAAAEEIISLAAIVSACGGIYTSHIRNEEDMVVEAIEEALRIGREARVSVQISHLKTMGEKNWHKLPLIFEKIEEALRMMGWQFRLIGTPTLLQALILTRCSRHGHVKGALMQSLCACDRSTTGTKYFPASWPAERQKRSLAKCSSLGYSANQGEEYDPLTDREYNDEQISAANVVVMLTPHSYFRQPPSEIVEILLFGTGKAYAFRDGQAYEVNWSIPTQDSVLTLTLPDGSPFPFKPGNTWIQVVGQSSVVTQPEVAAWRFEFKFP